MKAKTLVAIALIISILLVVNIIALGFLPDYFNGKNNNQNQTVIVAKKNNSSQNNSITLSKNPQTNVTNKTNQNSQSSSNQVTTPSDNSNPALNPSVMNPPRRTSAS
jgi:hypothetical protein